MRGLMITGGQSTYGLPWDCAVLLLVLALMLAIAVKLYPRLAE